MKKGYFITGTDTGVGKTVVTASLAVALRRQGFKVAVMKPVETGCPDDAGQLLAGDALFLRMISGCDAPMELINPYAFAEPIAPAIAAEIAGVTIDINHIRRCYQMLLAEHDIVLVEGAGGLLVPLNAHMTMLDMASSLSLPVLIVARNVPGAINHTSLTVEVARRYGTILGIVLNHVEQPRPDDLALMMNEQALKRWCKSPVHCKLPFLSSPVLTSQALLTLGELLLTDHLLSVMGLGAYPLHEKKARIMLADSFDRISIGKEEKDGIPGIRN